MYSYIKIKNFDNSKCRREFYLSGIHCWACKDEDKEELLSILDSLGYKTEGIYPKANQVIAAISYDYIDDFVTAHQEPNYLIEIDSFLDEPEKYIIKIKYNRVFSNYLIPDEYNEYYPIIEHPYQCLIMDEKDFHNYKKIFYNYEKIKKDIDDLEEVLFYKYYSLYISFINKNISLSEVIDEIEELEKYSYLCYLFLGRYPDFDEMSYKDIYNICLKLK